MRILLIVLTLLSVNILFSQDSSWQWVRVNEDLVIRLPGKITKQEQDTKGIAGGKIFVYTAKGKYSVLGLTVTPNKSNLGSNDNKSNKKMLDDLEEGARRGSKKQGYVCKTYPTTVDSIEGIRVLMYTSDTASAAYIQQSLVVVNDRMYSFFQAPKDRDEPVLIDEMDILLKSVRFNHKPVKEEKYAKSESTGYRVGYTIGQIFGYLIIAGAIYLIVRLIVSKSKKKKNVEDNYNY